MEEIYLVFIGMGVLALGILIGEVLARVTEDEIGKGQKWFKTIVIVGILGAIVTLIFKNDFIFFGFLFMAIVTSRSLKGKTKVVGKR